jgi:type I restriction enzyme, S subunit
MSSLITQTLGQICDEANGIIRTGPFGSQLHQSNYQIDGLPVIMPKDIIDGKVDGSKITRIGPADEDRLREHKLKCGDIVYGRRGDIGRRALIRNREDGWLCGTGSIRISLGNQVVDPEFLYYYLGNPPVIAWIQQQAIGATMPNLNSTIIRRIPITYPPLPTQRKIAAILSAYDDLIENNRLRIKILEQMAQAIYREWFVAFRFPGHERVRLVETEVGLAPEGWEVVKLGEIAQDVRRSVQPDQVDPETPYLGLEHLPRKSIALTEWGQASEVQSTKLLFKAGEILFGKIRPYFHKVGIAPVDGVCSSDIIVIVPKSPEYYAVVLSCVSSEAFVEQATMTSQGTKMPRANWDVLTKYPVVIPPGELLMQFNEVIRNFVDLVQNLVWRNRNLRRTRDLLLPKLVSGEVDMSGLDKSVD